MLKSQSMLKIFIFFLLVSSQQSFAQADSLPDRQAGIPAFVRDSLDNYVNRGLKDWQIPGIAVCIIKNGKVVVMKGYGVKDYDTKEKCDENTLFMIGSNTKAFTGTALAMLDADKKLSLDDKVTKWIPEFKLDNKAAGEQAIIRDLLCHRIGFRTFQGDFTYWTSNLTRKEVIEKMGHIKATYPFRTTWGYTNAAFLTAGEIIPKATGMQWEDYIKVKIFDPLEMKNTLALSKDFPKAVNKCSPYTMAEGKLVKIPFCYIDNLAAAGSIGSSVSDMSHWVMMQLDNGKYNGQQVIPPSVIAQTRFPHSIRGDGGAAFNEGHFSLYGLGWVLQEYCGRKIVSHTGGVNGFVTSVTLIPEEKLGIIVFTNTDQNSFYEALKWEIMDAYFSKPYRNYSNIYLTSHKRQFDAEQKKDQTLKDSVAMHLKTELPLTAYTGNYFNDVYGDMKCVIENGEFKMRFSHHPDMYAKLESLGGNRFYVTFTDPEFGKAVFPFHVENGKVKSVTVKVADFVEYNPYEFVRTTIK
jgi:CubicO group peptidase (beta-lactamase class C family)